MKTTLSKAVVSAALLLASPALAYEHLYTVWDPPEFDYYIADYDEDSLDPHFEYPVECIQLGFDAWHAAPCTDFTATYAGFIEPVGSNPPPSADYLNNFSFDDPAGKQAAGVLAVTYSTLTSPTIVFQQDGAGYFAILDRDIVYNDNVDWAREEDIPGNCNNETSMLAVTVHEIGHLFGMDHSCEENDACDDQDLLEATMYWTASPCDKSASTINPDDIKGFSALYGPYAKVVCNNELDPGADSTIAFGVLPFELKCAVDSKNASEITGVDWNWGDGESETTTETQAQHTYETAGNFTLSSTVHGFNESCGDWSFDDRRVGYVRACGVPNAEFTYEHVNGLTYRLLNETDVSVYGCIFQIQWDIFDEGGALIDSVQAWEPEFSFPEEGTYRVVLNVGGPAGTGAAELTFDVKNRVGKGYGCDSTNNGLLGFAGAVGGLGALLAIRRRKSR